MKFCCRKKNGTEVTSIKELQGRFEIHDKENSFIIKNTKETDDGLYSCELKDSNEKAEFHVIGEYNEMRCFIVMKTVKISFRLPDTVHIKKIPENSGVVEGEKLVITCKVSGTDPQITWKIGL